MGTSGWQLLWVGAPGSLIGHSREEFVRHNLTKYGLPLAIWVACEVWDFGTLATGFNGLREVEQDAIASQYSVSNGRVTITWPFSAAADFATWTRELLR